MTNLTFRTIVQKWGKYKQRMKVLELIKYFVGRKRNHWNYKDLCDTSLKKEYISAKEIEAWKQGEIRMFLNKVWKNHLH